MNGHCGGCRARAYGTTGDLMAEIPSAPHVPGTLAASHLLTLGGSGLWRGEAGRFRGSNTGLNAADRGVG